MANLTSKDKSNDKATPVKYIEGLKYMYAGVAILRRQVVARPIHLQMTHQI